MMKLLLLIVIVLLILISIFLLSKVTIHIEYAYCQDFEKFNIHIHLWKGLIKFNKEIQLPDENYQPSSYRESMYRHQNQSTSSSTEISMDDVQAAFQNVKEILSQMKSYQSAIKKLTSKIQITDLQVEIHYGSGEASSTALAAGVLWGLVGGILGIISQYFALLVRPKIDVIPYFSFRKPFETKIECIARLRMAKTILAGLKLARSLRK